MADSHCVLFFSGGSFLFQKCSCRKMEPIVPTTTLSTGMFRRLFHSGSDVRKRTEKILSRPFNMSSFGERRMANNLMFMVSDLLKTESSDKTIFFAIHDFMTSNAPSLLMKKANVGRAMHRANEMVSFLKTATNNEHVLSDIHTYLDVGCSHGEISNEIRSLLPTNVVFRACDIIERPQYIPDHSYFRIDENNPSLSCFSFLQEEEDGGSGGHRGTQLVTCIMSLHHMKHVDRMLHLLSQAMRPGSYLLLREHNVDDNRLSVTSSIDYTFLDMIHGLYSISWCPAKEFEDESFCETYFAHYRSSQQWTELLKTHGFSLLMDTANDSSKNIFIAYYAVYVRTDDVGCAKSG